MVWDGTRRHAVLLVVGIMIATGAVAEIGRLVVTDAPDWGLAIAGWACAMFVAGLVVALRYNPLDDLASVDARRVMRGSRRSFVDLLVLVLVVAVVAFPFGAVVAIRDGDPTGWFLSSVFGLLSAIPLLLAWLVDVLVVLPIVSIIGAALGRKGSSRLAAAGGALFLAIVALAVTTTFAVPSAEHGYVGRTGRVLSALGVLVGLPLGTVSSPVLLWCARLALLAFVAAMVWFVREGRATQRRDRRRGTGRGGGPDRQQL